MSKRGDFDVELKFDDTDEEVWVVLTMSISMAGDLAQAFDPNDLGWNALSAELLEAVALDGGTEPCDHKWVDARNKHVLSGRVCLSCAAFMRGNDV